MIAVLVAVLAFLGFCVYVLIWTIDSLTARVERLENGDIIERPNQRNPSEEDR